MKRPEHPGHRPKDRPTAAPPGHAPPRPRPSGLTLIELLVVIAIISTLVTTAIPVLSPSGPERIVREASRQLNTLMAGAQARAIETGRPFGVQFKRLSADTRSPDDNGVCVELSMVEVPPVYAGFDDASRARVCDYMEEGPAHLRQLRLSLVRYVNTQATQNIAGLPPGYEREATPPRFFRPGDIVQTQGRRYELLDPTLEYPYAPGQRALIATRERDGLLGVEEDGYFQAAPAGAAWAFLVVPVIDEQPLALRYDGDGAPLPPPETLANQDLSAQAPAVRSLWTAAAPYRVFRRPTPTSAQPVQLPAGAAIDLQASGFASRGRLYQPSIHWDFTEGEPRLVTDPVTILFTPEGTLGQATAPDYAARREATLDRDQGQNEPTGAPTLLRPTSTLAMLVGRRELIPAPAAETVPDNQSGALLAEQPLELGRDLAGAQLDEEGVRELLEQYNWLHPASRWVVVGARSGSLSTVPNAPIDYRDLDALDLDGDEQVDVQEQVRAARANTLARTAVGGR